MYGCICTLCCWGVWWERKAHTRTLYDIRSFSSSQHWNPSQGRNWVVGFLTFNNQHLGECLEYTQYNEAYLNGHVYRRKCAKYKISIRRKRISSANFISLDWGKGGKKLLEPSCLASGLLSKCMYIYESMSKYRDIIVIWYSAFSLNNFSWAFVLVSTLLHPKGSDKAEIQVWSSGRGHLDSSPSAMHLPPELGGRIAHPLVNVHYHLIQL